MLAIAKLLTKLMTKLVTKLVTKLRVVLKALLKIPLLGLATPTMLITFQRLLLPRIRM